MARWDNEQPVRWAEQNFWAIRLPPQQAGCFAQNPYLMRPPRTGAVEFPARACHASFQSSSYVVAYQPRPPLVRGHATRPLSPVDFTEACEWLLATAHHHGCAYWLLDARQYPPPPPRRGGGLARRGLFAARGRRVGPPAVAPGVSGGARRGDDKSTAHVCLADGRRGAPAPPGGLVHRRSPGAGLARPLSPPKPPA